MAHQFFPTIKVREKAFELFEHTADIGIRVRGKSQQDLFRNAGLALFQISAEKLPGSNNEKHKIIITQKANDIEELFVNWLNELLSLSAAEGLVFEEIQINNITEQLVEAVAVGSDVKNYKLNTEIKAATYHELKVRKGSPFWMAEVILDV